MSYSGVEQTPEELAKWINGRNTHEFFGIHISS